LFRVLILRHPLFAQRQVDHRKPLPPGGVSALGDFTMKSLKEEDPPEKQSQFFPKIGVVFQGGPLPQGFSSETTQEENLPGFLRSKCREFAKYVSGESHISTNLYMWVVGWRHWQVTCPFLLQIQNSSVSILILLVVLKCEYCSESKLFVGLGLRMKKIFPFSGPALSVSAPFSPPTQSGWEEGC